MARTRIGMLGLVAGAVITLAASTFAIGAAVTSDDDGDTTAGGDVTAPADPAASGSNPGSETTTARTQHPATATARFDIEIAGFRFNPQDTVVAVGTEVVWTNNDTDEHSIISDDGLFASSNTFGQGESYAVVFTEPGTYEYHCGVHPFMTDNSITVEA